MSRPSRSRGSSEGPGHDADGQGELVAQGQVTLPPGFSVAGREDRGFDEIRLGEGQQHLEAYAAGETGFGEQQVAAWAPWAKARSPGTGAVGVEGGGDGGGGLRLLLGGEAGAVRPGRRSCGRRRKTLVGCQVSAGSEAGHGPVDGGEGDLDVGGAEFEGGEQGQAAAGRLQGGNQSPSAWAMASWNAVRTPAGRR